MGFYAADLEDRPDQVDYRHLINMTDETGILQFSQFSQPDPQSGHTLDDNARALLCALNMEGPERERLIRIYMNFIEKAWQPDSWHNLKLGGCFVADLDSQDSKGRAFLACCYAALSGHAEASRWGRLMAGCTLPAVQDLRSPRSMAYVLLALSRLISGKLAEGSCRELALRYCEALLNMFIQNSSPGWQWFEKSLTYCNGIMPQALLAYYRATGDKRTLKIGEESLGFLGDNLFRRGYLNIVGNKGWWKKGSLRADYDQQPVDACSAVLAFAEAYRATGRKCYYHQMYSAYRWYKGDNINAMPLYDPKSGGCYDALVPAGFNQNQGAEALLSLLITTQLINSF